MENTICSLITALSVKFDDLLAQSASFEGAISSLRQDHAELSVKVEANFSLLSSRIDSIAASHQKLSQSANLTGDLDSLVFELAERENRKCNLMIFGLPEKHFPLC